jgi:mRNA interferase RelE/StbE
MAYRIEFTHRACKQFKSLSREVQLRLRPRIESLAKNPRPRGVKKLADSESIYRLRDGDYRVVYQVQDKVLLVLVLKIGHRREVYRTPPE